MEILHISPYALRGGCEKNCFLYIKASPQFHHTIIVLGEKGPISPDWENLGVKVKYLNSLNLSVFQLKLILENTVEKKTFDIVFYWSTVRISTVLASLKKTCQHIRVYIGNPSEYTFFQLLKENFLGFFWGRPKDVILLPCSEYVNQSIQNEFYFNSFRTKVLLNPIELPKVRISHNLPTEGSIQVGMVARLDPIKNHELLIRAYSRVSVVYPNMILNLVGDGILKNYLVNLSKQLGLEQKVVFHGDVKNVYEHLENWSAFIFSTTIKEGLGSAVIEAMANGLPCLLPDLPMMREIAPSPVKVKWFTANSLESLENNWIELFEHREDFLAMSESVYNRSLHFSPEQYVRESLNL